MENRQSSTSQKIEKEIIIDYSINDVKNAIKKIFEVVHMRYIPAKNGLNDIFGIYQFFVHDKFRDNALCSIDISTISEKRTKVSIYISYRFTPPQDTSDNSTLISILNNYLSVLAKSLVGESLTDVVEDIENEDKIAQEEDGITSCDSRPIHYDVLFAEIARNAVESGSISTSMIQRNYEVGFNRAGRIMMQLERAGIVGRQLGAKPRKILFYDLSSLEAQLQELGIL